MQQRATTFIAETEATTGAEPPQLVRDEFDTFLESGILALGLLRLLCGDCGYDKLVTARVDDERYAGQPRTQGA